MKDWRLTREEGNRFLATIKRLGLDPNDFSWSETDRYPSHYVETTHGPTGYAFQFSAWTDNNNQLRYSSNWSPGIAGRAHASFHTRSEQLQAADTWLAVVKREHETPDLWAAVAAEREFLTGAADESARRFSSEEQRLLVERLDQLEQQIVRIATPTPDQRAGLADIMSQAKAAAGSTTRGQWKLLFAGALINAILNLGLDPERAKQVLHFATLYIGPLISRLSGLLSP